MSGHKDMRKADEAFDIARDPIKHFVRMDGWISKARNRLQILAVNGCARKFGIRYFSLCGKYGLDIFLFQREDLILHNGKGFPSVYYCESDRSDYVTVKERLGQTLGDLRSFQGQMEQGPFRRHIKETPFDVVNLDFSGVCFPPGDPPFSKTLKSIESLIHLQEGHSFDLFITFKALRRSDNEDAIEELTITMNENFAESADIRDKFDNLFHVSIEQLLAQDYGKFLLVTFPKIIFGFGIDFGFEVECPKKYVYTRHRGQYQIIKFLFSFKSIRRAGSFSRAAVSALDADTRKASYLVSVLSHLDNLPIDVDEELEGNPALLDLLRQDTEQLVDDIIALSFLPPVL